MLPNEVRDCNSKRQMWLPGAAQRSRIWSPGTIFKERTAAPEAASIP